jgi:hypothetical protein
MSCIAIHYDSSHSKLEEEDRQAVLSIVAMVSSNGKDAQGSRPLENLFGIAIRKWRSFVTARFMFLRSRGYTVIEIWECEIEKQPERVMAKLKKLLAKGKPK